MPVRCQSDGTGTGLAPRLFAAFAVIVTGVRSGAVRAPNNLDGPQPSFTVRVRVWSVFRRWHSAGVTVPALGAFFTGALGAGGGGVRADRGAQGALAAAAIGRSGGRVSRRVDRRAGRRVGGGRAPPAEGTGPQPCPEAEGRSSTGAPCQR